MKQVLSVFTLLVLASRVSAFDIEECNWKGKLENVVHPAHKNVRMFYNDQVAVYYLDYEEPAACSYALAIVLPDVTAEIPMRKCVEISCFSGIDIKNAKSSYDPIKGLLLTIPYRVYNGGGTDPAKEPVQIRVNLQNASVRVE